LADAAVTVAATFVGAYLAFWFERNARRTEQTEQRVAAANKALFTLSNYWNILKQYEQRVLIPGREGGADWFTIGVDPVVSQGVTAFDIDSLVFMLRSDAQLFSQLILEQERFQKLLQYIEKRNDYVLHRARPLIEAAGIGEGQLIDIRRVEIVLGPQLVQMLKDITDAITAYTREDLSSFQKTFTALRLAFKKTFPKHQFISYSFSEALTMSPTAAAAGLPSRQAP
jgi:hypothetical protein